MTNKKLTAEETAEMESMSRENDLKPAPTYKLASLKLNGKEGNYSKTNIINGEMEVDENGRAKLEDLGKVIKGTILRSRIMFTANTPEEEMFTNEADKGGRFSVLVKTISDKGNSMITWAFSGSSEEVKARYPELKYISILYFILEDTGEIVRFKIHGMSLGKLFDYFKEFEKDEHIWEYISEFGFKADKNKYGNFFVNTIKRGKKVEDITIIQNALREVNGKIEDIELYYKEKEELRAQSEEAVVEMSTDTTAEGMEGGQTPPIVPEAAVDTKQNVDDGELDVSKIDFDAKNEEPTEQELDKVFGEGEK